MKNKLCVKLLSLFMGFFVLWGGSVPVMAANDADANYNVAVSSPGYTYDWADWENTASNITITIPQEPTTTVKKLKVTSDVSLGFSGTLDALNKIVIQFPKEIELKNDADESVVLTNRHELSYYEIKSLSTSTTYTLSYEGYLYDTSESDFAGTMHISVRTVIKEGMYDLDYKTYKRELNSKASNGCNYGEGAISSSNYEVAIFNGALDGIYKTYNCFTSGHSVFGTGTSFTSLNYYNVDAPEVKDAANTVGVIFPCGGIYFSFLGSIVFPKNMEKIYTGYYGKPVHAYVYNSLKTIVVDGFNSVGKQNCYDFLPNAIVHYKGTMTEWESISWELGEGCTATNDDVKNIKAGLQKVICSDGTVVYNKDTDTWDVITE